MPFKINVDDALPIPAQNITERIIMNKFLFQRDRFGKVKIADFQQIEVFKIFDHFLLRLIRLNKVLDINILAEHSAAFFEIGRKADRFNHFNRIQITDRLGHKHLEAAFAHADVLVFILIQNLCIHNFQLMINDIQIIAD